MQSNKWYFFLHDIDIFGKEPELYYKGRKTRSTLIGRIFTLLYIIIYIGVFIYKLIIMIKREDISYISTFDYSKKIPSILLTNDNFYGGFTIINQIGETLFNESIYFPKAIFSSGKNLNGEWEWRDISLELERCKLEKIEFNEDMYCFKNLNSSLEGSMTSDSYSYIEIQIFPCLGDGCYEKEFLSSFLENSNFMLFMKDSYLTPQFYKSPVQSIRKSIYTPISLTFYQSTFLNFQETIIETNEDIFGFSSSNIKKEKFLKYENSQTYSLPMYYDIFNEELSTSVGSIRLQLSENIFIIKRFSTTFIDVLADVGGIMKVILTSFDLILSFIINWLYEKSIVNNLFEFDLGKKLIIIKSNKNNIPKENNSKKLNFVNPIFINEQNNDKIKNNKNEGSLSKNNLVEDIILYSKTKKNNRNLKKKIK